MSELFIKLNIDRGKCLSSDGCTTCVKVCPVAVFKKAADQNQVEVNEANEDECTLCNLCLENCPVQAITLQKLY